MVLLFNGTVMPLDKDIISGGSSEEKKQHLLETIVDMVAIKVDELIESGDVGQESKQNSRRKSTSGKSKKVAPSVSDKGAPPITRQDIHDFVHIDLHLIDSKSYFDKVFGKKKRER